MLHSLHSRFQVARGSVVLTNARGEHDEVHAGEEGAIERGALTVAAAPALRARPRGPSSAHRQARRGQRSGLGALRAYKPGESRDRDWNLALAKHDVKVRIVGPIARTEITETFRNDCDDDARGRLPVPAAARRADRRARARLNPARRAASSRARSSTRSAARNLARRDRQGDAEDGRRAPQQEMIWVEGRWRDPALLDWKRGGRFELHVYPIPAKGARTIKIAYTQVVTPRGPWRQYVYPLPHSQDGSTVADQLTVDVEVRGAAPGLTRAVGYDMCRREPLRRTSPR